MPTKDGFNTLFEYLSLNFYLYIVHTVQVINQNNAIKNVMAKMNDDLSVCVVIMEFKINFETMEHCNNAVEHFGKRGSSYHGALVLYYV